MRYRHDYIALDGGYSYARSIAGVTLRNPHGREVYFQPGDDASIFYKHLEALDEIPDDRRATIVDMAFREYFL